MKTLSKESIRRITELGLLVVCASTLMYFLLSMVNWFRNKISQQGLVATLSQINNWFMENPESIAGLCVALVVFKIFIEPFIIGKPEDRDSFFYQLSVLVVGPFIVGVLILAVLSLKNITL